MSNRNLSHIASGSVLKLVHEALTLTEAERKLLCRLVDPTGDTGELTSMQVEQRRLQFARFGQDNLTAREREVGRYVISGATNKEIARHLGLARYTIEAHRRRAFDKLGAESTADFVRLAFSIGLTPLFVPLRTSPN